MRFPRFTGQHCMGELRYRMRRSVQAWKPGEASPNLAETQPCGPWGGTASDQRSWKPLMKDAPPLMALVRFTAEPEASPGAAWMLLPIALVTRYTRL